MRPEEPGSGATGRTNALNDQDKHKGDRLLQLNGENRHSRHSMRHEDMDDYENGKRKYTEEADEDGEGAASGRKF